MNRPTEYWQGYRTKIYGPEPLSRIQERETSLAFYAGMFAAINQLAKIADAAIDEEDGAAAMEEFRQEMLAASQRANLDRSDGKS